MQTHLLMLISESYCREDDLESLEVAEWVTRNSGLDNSFWKGSFTEKDERIGQSLCDSQWKDHLDAVALCKPEYAAVNVPGKSDSSFLRILK